MKSKILFSCLTAGILLAPFSAQANEASLMCGPDHPIPSSDTRNMCSPEDYGFSYDQYGNLRPSGPVTYHDGPTISAERPDQRSSTPPRDILRDTEILTGSVLGSAMYSTSIFTGTSHEDAMNLAEFGYYAGEVFGAVGGNGSGMIESPIPGLAGSSSVMPQSPPIMEQQLGNRGSIYPH